MRKLLFAVLFFVISSNVYGAHLIIPDVGNDGKVGLGEAIYILQTLSGIRPDLNEIVAFYQQLKTYIEQEDTDGAIELVHHNFLDSGKDKAKFQSEIQDFISAYSNIQISFYLSDIMINGDFASLREKRIWQGTLSMIEGEVHGDDEITQAYLKRVNGNWKYYGNQEKHDVWIASVTNQWYGSTCIAMRILDLNREIADFSITGPGVQGVLGPADFRYYDWSGEGAGWHLRDCIVIDPSQLPYEYSFSIVDSGAQYSYIKKVVSAVQNFPTDLSPSGGNIQELSEISWSGISPAGSIHYFVQLFDSSDNLLWESERTPLDSLSYLGRPLRNGSYYYNLVSKDEYGNQSLARASFQIN